MLKRIKKAFTLVELMVVIAILAVLATVSIIGYQSFITRERINNAITEATQAREVIISKIIASNNGIVSFDYTEDKAILTYEGGDLIVSNEFHSDSVSYDILSESSFNTRIKEAFPSIASLPGIFTIDGDIIYYHSDGEFKPESGNRVDEPSYPFSKEDVVVDIYSLDYMTYKAQGTGDGGYSSNTVRITVSQRTLILQVGETKPITYTVKPEGTSASIEYENDCISIKKGAGTIAVTGEKVGTSTIRIEAEGIGKTINVIVSEEGRTALKVPVFKSYIKYDGQPHTPSASDWLNYDPTKMTISGLSEEVEPGSYPVTFELIDKVNYCWADNFSTDNKQVNWRIGKIQLSIPSQKGELIYKNPSTIGQIIGVSITNKQIPEWNNYDSSLMELSYPSDGKILHFLSFSGESNPGTYTANFSIKDCDHYCWSDGYDDPETNSMRVVFWTIQKLKIPKPTLNQTSYEYTGKSTGPGLNGINGYDDDYMTVNRSETQGTAVGTYTINVQVKFNSDYYCWEDGTKDDLQLEWEITKKAVTVPTVSNNTFVFDNKEHSIELNNYDSNYMEGLDKQKNVGDYTTTIKLKSPANTYWAGSTDDTSNKTFEWHITKKTVNKPSGFTGNLTYNGKAQTTTAFGGYDPSTMNITGNTETAAGTHTATITPNGNCTWTDGTVTPVDIDWTIKKATVSKPTLKQTSYEYTGSTITPSFTYDSNMVELVSGGSGTNVAGLPYTAEFKLKDTESCTWSGGGTSNVKIDWYITKLKLSFPKEQTNSLIYKASTSTYTASFDVSVNTTYVSVSGNTITSSNKTDIVGEHEATFSLRDKTNTCWTDNTTADKTVPWSVANVNEKLNIDPKNISGKSNFWQSGTLTYNGEKQTPTISNFDSNKMVMTVTPQTNAGDYTLSIAPAPGYEWKSGGTTPTTVTWKIGKADQDVKLSSKPTSIKKNNTVEITVTNNSLSNATIKVEVNNNYLTSSVSNNKVSITGKKETVVKVVFSSIPFDTEIKITINGNSNYNDWEESWDARVTSN